MEKNTKNQEDENEEITLFEEGTTENNNTNSESTENEMLTLPEFYLECARFGELDDMKNALKDAEKDFNYNIKDFNGNTALHMSSANGHLNIVKYLIEDLKCDINCKNNSNNTPLHWAAINGQKDIVCYLLDKNADFDIVNNNNKKASEEAYDNCYYDISEIILNKENEKNPKIIESEIDKDEFDDKNN